MGGVPPGSGGVGGAQDGRSCHDFLDLPPFGLPMGSFVWLMESEVTDHQKNLSDVFR